jgi:hypothetical protein
MPVVDVDVDENGLPARRAGAALFHFMGEGA